MVKLPFHFDALFSQSPLRGSQETILKLAYKNVEEKKYKDAIVFFERIEHSLHDEKAKEMVKENIKVLLDLLKEKEMPKEEPPATQPPISQTPPAMKITVDNISLSGVEMTGSEKALEVFSRLFSKEKQEELEEVLEEAAYEEVKKIEEKLFKEIETKSLEALPPSLETKEEEKLEFPLPPAIQPPLQEKPQEDSPFKPKDNDQEPIKVEQVAPKKKLEKIKPLDLTFNFSNVFYSKFYLKYSEIFNEAAHLVREKRLDEAMEYYKVLLDQKLPETLKLMIQQNVEDLKLAILNTFKYSDTIVKMDESGNLVRVDDNTIRVFETGSAQNDVYFKEES